MKKSSWIILSICLMLTGLLGFSYLKSLNVATPLTQDQAVEMLHTMREAVRKKSVNGIMANISTEPGTRIASFNADQFRAALARAFRQSEQLTAETDHVSFQPGNKEANLAFDLFVKHTLGQTEAVDYSGRITLHLKRMEVSHLLGLYHKQEWLITGAETTGPDPANYGE